MPREHGSRIELREVLDAAELEAVAALMRSDVADPGQIGGFYGRAPERLAPLLDLGTRRVWLILADQEPAGFIDADLVDGRVGLSYFIAPPMRRRGIGRQALGRFLGLRVFPEAETLVGAVAPENAASRALLGSTGFVSTGPNEFGEEVWERPVTSPRARSGPARFLRADGSIDRTR